MNLFLLNIILALLWGAVTVNFSPGNLIFGFILGMVSLWLLRHEFHSKYFERGFTLFSLLGFFLYELLLSGFRVARDVLMPGRNFRPGIVAVPLTVDRDIEITLLANLITLTPGTMSVDVSTDKSTLYVHAMDVEKAEDLIRDIKSGFERKIMEALR